MSRGVDDGSNIPLQLSICCLWWHGGDTYVPLIMSKEIIIHVFLHIYMSEIE